MSARELDTEFKNLDQNEVERFAALASQWWTPQGKFRILHEIGPVRLTYIRDRICHHYKRDANTHRCLQGLRILDIGCGGGLIAGCAVALTHRWPGVRVYAVEPEGFDDTRRSLDSGARERISGDSETLSDALRVQTPGRITFDINRRLLTGGLTVTDGETLSAMAVAFAHSKLVLEPGGAVALAAALNARVDCRDKVTVVVASGGNVDRRTFAMALDRNGLD